MTRRFLLAATLLLSAAMFRPVTAAADPASFITDVGNQALAVLAKRELGPDQKRQQFGVLFRQSLDLPYIARFVLGRYWQVATPAEQQEYVKLFEDYVVLAYSARLQEYSGETFRVLGSRADGDSMLVNTEIIRPGGGQPVKVDWRLYTQGGSYKIIDVVVAGVSMAVTQRSEFASVIQRSGGQVQGLLTQLRQKVASAQ